MSDYEFVPPQPILHVGVTHPLLIMEGDPEPFKSTDDPQPPTPRPIPQGWQCPKCQRIHSPFKYICDFCAVGGGVVSYTPVSEMP